MVPDTTESSNHKNLLGGVKYPYFHKRPEEETSESTHFSHRETSLHQQELTQLANPTALRQEP